MTKEQVKQQILEDPDGVFDELFDEIARRGNVSYRHIAIRITCTDYNERSHQREVGAEFSVMGVGAEKREVILEEWWEK